MGPRIGFREGPFTRRKERSSFQELPSGTRKGKEALLCLAIGGVRRCTDSIPAWEKKKIYPLTQEKGRAHLRE